MIQKNYWEHFHHEADIGIRGVGSNLAEAFAMTALALTNIVVESDKVQANQLVEIRCSAPDLELLLVDWINAIIYEMATRSMLFSQFEVCINDLALHAKIRGEKIDRQRHRPVVDVKGATFTELKVYYANQYWLAQCVVDV